MELARRGAAYLYRSGARKVWVFGSVAKGRRLDFRSDIDFAVEGLASERRWQRERSAVRQDLSRFAEQLGRAAVGER